ncbi:MAG: hypothetical protein ACPLRU_09360, partial [Desulfofundulus sp.]
DYVHDPPADDGTGTCWTYREYQGLKVSSSPNWQYYTSGQFWALVPGFKQVPKWNPDPGDPNWGTLGSQTVPAYQWVQVPGFRAFFGPGNEVMTDASPSGAPYIVWGYCGSPQSTPPAGPYMTDYVWEHTKWKLVASGSDRSSTASSIMDRNWPNRITIAIGDPENEINGLSQDTLFYTDASRTRLVIFYPWNYWAGGWSWKEYALEGTDGAAPPSLYGSYWRVGDYYYEVHFGSVKSQQRFLVVANAGGSEMEMYRQVPLYYPIYGSYVEIVSYQRDYHGNVTGSTVRCHLVVYNPSDYPVTVTVSRGLLNGDTYYNSYANIPISGTAVVQPHQYA